ncbi:hypothetical protein GCM10022262_06570 [Georgenia daeguensis]|uniref:Uncharacterized protein n=2 Tax=Georgenia daeguensis TaxID=908355 RepID=A0ABP8EQT0_9MICO
MQTKIPGTPARARGRSPRVARKALLVAAATLVLLACSPSPDEPEAGELSAVVVSRSDHPMPFDGGTVDSWSRVIVLTRDELLAAFEATWPGRDAPDDHDIPRVGIELNVDDLPAGRLAEVNEGRFRVPWPEPDRYLCLGDEYQGVVTTAGCVLVDAEAPVKVTLEISIGGFRLRT